MKIKLEYVVLGVLIVALVGYLAFRKTDRTHYTLPTLPAVSAEKISKIEMAGPEGRVTLEKRDAQWRIVPGDYPADAEKVRRVLDAVGDLTLTALVSESESYARYELDDAHKVTLKAWDGDRLAREVDIGKAAGTFQHTHVKLPGDPNVYHARGDFRMTVDRPAGDFRDKSIMRFDAAQAAAVEIETADHTLRLSASPSGAEAEGNKAGAGSETPGEKATPAAPKRVWSGEAGQTVPGGTVDAIVGFMAALDADGFLDKAPGEGGEKPLYRVTVTAGEKTHTLAVFDKPGEDAAAFPAMASDSPYPFELSQFDVDDLKKNIESLTQPAAPASESGGKAPTT